MLTGELIGGALLVSPDGTGKPIVETAAPEAPEGYEMEPSWRDDGARIVQAWEAVPVAGSVDDAVRELARMQAASLGDEDAARVAALFPAWTVGAAYDAGDRVTRSGGLRRRRPGDPRREDVGIDVRRQRLGAGYHRRPLEGNQRIGRTDHA